MSDVARIERLKMRLREQTLQTMETSQQIHDRVVQTLKHHNVIPKTVNVDGHPIEQVVGACIAHLRAENLRLLRALQQEAIEKVTRNE